MQIDIKNYLKQNLQRPKELDFTDEVIEYLVNLESEVSRYKAALDTAKGALIGISMPEIQTEMFDSVRFAQIALEQITKALEKESK